MDTKFKMAVTKNNISEFLPEVAEQYPDRTALVCVKRRGNKSEYPSITFRQLNTLSDSFACEIRRNGVRKGMKVLLMLRPGFDFIAATFAVFKTGAIPVLIDPGMGIRNLLGCVRKTAPDAMLAIPKAHWIALLFPGTFNNIKMKLSTGGGITPPGVKRLHTDANDAKSAEIEKTSPDEMAAIVFTTGSTGAPKGGIYTHKIYVTQLQIIKEEYGAGPSETDMPAFPLFALFSAALGMKSVIPDFNPSRPAEADPAQIVRIIEDNNVTFSFASPTLWRNVSDYCIRNGIRLKTLRKALMAGAPVPALVHANMKKIMPDGGETIVPYGATECLPIANFTGSEMLAETAADTENGKGYCVGRPIKGITIKVISPSDSEVEKWNDNLILADGKTGEIAVSGPVVTPEYYNEPEHTKNAKIADPSGFVWHRIGDTGYFDEKGRLWFTGRKTHRISTKNGILYPVRCEAIFNRHPDVLRSALVGAGGKGMQTPVLIVEPRRGKMPRNISERKNFIADLERLAGTSPLTIGINKFLFHPSFPVDIRHNAKIFREKLAIWAAGKI